MTGIVYFDCFSGCAGDMLLGSLIDAGLDIEVVRTGLASLGFSGYSISASKVKRSSINGTRFEVSIDENIHHEHRSLSRILEHIQASHLSDRVKKQSSEVFHRLGTVEAAVHGVPLEDVHFHEIGAVDSIVDIVGTVIGLEALGIEEVYVSPLPAGNGSVNTEHGCLPVPAPATLKLLAEAGVPLRSGDEPGRPQAELVTPTGAALVTVLGTFRQPAMNITGLGTGAGTRDFPGWPNILRAWLGTTPPPDEPREMVLLETNIDDMNPQVFGYVMDRLFTAGAADVWFTPIHMKKNRPAVMLNALAPASLENSLTDIILEETSTLGVRVRPITRHTAAREVFEVDTQLGKIHVKIKKYRGRILGIVPEYDDCRRLAESQGLPLIEVRRIIEEAARRGLTGQGGA